MPVKRTQIRGIKDAKKTDNKSNISKPKKRLEYKTNGRLDNGKLVALSNHLATTYPNQRKTKPYNMKNINVDGIEEEIQNKSSKKFKCGGKLGKKC